MPADTYSATLGLLLMGTGNDNNTWGNNANSSVFQIAEDAIANLLTNTVTGGTLDLSGSPPPAGPSQARYAAMRFSGSLGSNQSVKVPNLSKIWLVHNNTSGAYTLTFTTPSGSPSAAIPQGTWAFVWCDGSNNIYVGPPANISLTQWLGIDGTVGAPGISFASESSSGVYRKSAGVLGVSIGGTEVLEVSAAGINVVNGSLLVGGGGVIPPGIEQHYAGIELPTSGWLWCDNTTYSRATYANLFAAITKTATANASSGSATLSSVSADLRGKGLIGAVIEGTGIPFGTTVTAMTSSTITMSANATATNTGITIRLLPWGQGDGSTTFGIPDRRYRSLVGRDDMNNNPAGRWASFDGTRLVTGNISSAGEESHTLTVNEMATHNHSLTVSDPGHWHYTYGPSGITASSAYTGGIGSVEGSPTHATGSVTTGITVSESNVGSSWAHNNMPPFGVTNVIIKT